MVAKIVLIVASLSPGDMTMAAIQSEVHLKNTFVDNVPFKGNVPASNRKLSVKVNHSD